MTTVLKVLVCGFTGWHATLVMKQSLERADLFTIIVGLFGAVTAGILVVPLFGGAPIASGVNDMRLLIASCAGLAILLGMVDHARRGTVRQIVQEN